MAEQKYNIGCGTGSLGTLTFITFLVLKLTGVIDWSWWWVTAPLWISYGLTLIFLIIALALYAAIDTKYPWLRKL